MMKYIIILQSCTLSMTRFVRGPSTFTSYHVTTTPWTVNRRMFIASSQDVVAFRHSTEISHRGKDTTKAWSQVSCYNI